MKQPHDTWRCSSSILLVASSHTNGQLVNCLKVFSHQCHTSSGQSCPLLLQLRSRSVVKLGLYNSSMATANTSDQQNHEKTLICDVLKSVLNDIGAPEYLQRFLVDDVDDTTIAHQAEMGRLKPGKYGLPEDKCAAFIELCRERLVAPTYSSLGAAQRGLPSRLPPLQPALDTSLHSVQTEYVAAASSQPAGDASPLSHLSSSHPLSPAAPASPVDAATLLRGLNLEVIEELGKGAFGTVFRCEDRTQKREIAVKLVNGVEKEALQARREGQKLLRAKHNHIVGMYKVHPNDDKSTWCALEMELVKGGDMSHHLEAHRRSECRLPHKAVLRFSRQLLEAIVYVHNELDWLHGDIKPQNILVQSKPLSAGRPLEDYSSATIKLADFGEAKVLDQQHSKGSVMHLTNATTMVDGKLKGTLWYLSPEALQGASRGYERAKTDDLWSACLVILEMDTGLTLQQLMTAPGSVNIAKVMENTSKELLPLLHSVLVVPAASRCKHASELLSMLDASENPLFIWQLYDDAGKKYVDVHPASSVVLENAFVANNVITNLPEALGAPLDLQFDIKEIIASSTGLGWQTQKSSGKKWRIRRLLNTHMLNSNQSIPTWQQLVDGREWVQCSPVDCAKLDIDEKKKNGRVNPLEYRRLELEPARIGEVQLPHPLNSEPYKVAARDADFEMMNKRVQDSLPEWKITEMEQVVNSTLASEYAKHRHGVAARRNGNPNEKIMFHFCSEFAMNKIWKEGEGHDPRLSNWAEVGKGAYFSKHAIYGYAYKCFLWPFPPDFEVKPEPPIGHTMKAFASLVCLGDVADIGPGCETCPSPEWDAWKKELPHLPKPTRPPARTLPSDPAERRHFLDLAHTDAPLYDSVKSTEGDLDTHPHSKNIVLVKRLGYRQRVRDLMHPRLLDRAKEWAEQYVLFKPANSYPMFILTLTKYRDSEFGPQQLLNAGCEVPLLKQIGFDASHFKALGKTASEMLIAGWPIPDLKSAGFDASSLLAGGCEQTELTSAGYTAPQVNEAVAIFSKTNKSSEVCSFVTIVRLTAAATIPSLMSVRSLQQLPMPYVL
jgi:serine/threonine protein kinase